MKTTILNRGILLLCIGLGLLSGCSGVKPEKKSAQVWFKVDPDSAGLITGKAMFDGKIQPGRKVDMDGDPQCANLHKNQVLDESIAVSNQGANALLANVFVYIKQGLEDKKFEPSADQVEINQQGCWFGPRVLGIQVGQTLKVTNSDPLTHNIHPVAIVNREWNQSQPAGAEPFVRRFTRPEVMIRVKCNIHQWMHAWIGVVEHPYFAVTGKNGSFELRNVPPGNYILEAWHEELGRQEQPITLAPSGKSEAVFSFK